MLTPRSYSTALDPYLLAALLGQTPANPTLPPLGWATGAAPTQVPVAPQGGGTDEGGGPLVPGQPITEAVTLPTDSLGVLSPELWNALSPEEQYWVTRYGWPLPAPEAGQSMTEEDAATARAAEQAKLRQLQLQNEVWDSPRTTAKTLDQNLVGQALNNAIMLNAGLDPRIVYGYDPEAARQQQAFENSMARGDLSARWASIAQALAQAATNAELETWQTQAQWGLPNVGDVYALQQPGGFIETALARSGMGYTPTPARDVPTPNLWANLARAQQTLGGR